MNKQNLLAVALWATLTPFAHAATYSPSMTYDASGAVSGVQERASATFTFQGNDLLVTLQNTSPVTSNPGTGQVGPGSILSGLFFDLTGNPGLTPVSATSSGIFNPGVCNPGPCTGVTNVGGEWGYAVGSYGGALGHEGIASSGYVTTGPHDAGNFNGANLNGPVSLGGIDFAILSKHWTLADLNGGASREPYDQGSVTFELAGVTGLGLGNLSNVSFQYGTSLTEANLGGSTSPVPEPADAMLISVGLVALAGRIKRKRRTR